MSCHYPIGTQEWVEGGLLRKRIVSSRGRVVMVRVDHSEFDKVYTALMTRIRFDGGITSMHKRLGDSRALIRHLAIILGDIGEALEVTLPKPSKISSKGSRVDNVYTIRYTVHYGQWSKTIGDVCFKQEHSFGSREYIT
jgi:hypothetical protein